MNSNFTWQHFWMFESIIRRSGVLAYIYQVSRTKWYRQDRLNIYERYLFLLLSVSSNKSSLFVKKYCYKTLTSIFGQMIIEYFRVATIDIDITEISFLFILPCCFTKPMSILLRLAIDCLITTFWMCNHTLLLGCSVYPRSNRSLLGISDEPNKWHTTLFSCTKNALECELTGQPIVANEHSI